MATAIEHCHGAYYEQTKLAVSKTRWLNLTPRQRRLSITALPIDLKTPPCPLRRKPSIVNQQSAISKRWATGGIGTMRQQIIYNKSDTPPAEPIAALQSDWTALVEAEVQHPLMRNRGTLINRIPVVLASLNEDISIADFEIQVRNLVRDVEVAYWNLYVAYRGVSTAIIGRNSAIATQRFAELQLENGAGTVTEVAQAKEQYFNFRARLESALAGSNVLGDERLGRLWNRTRSSRTDGPSCDRRKIDPTDRRTKPGSNELRLV